MSSSSYSPQIGEILVREEREFHIFEENGDFARNLHDESICFSSQFNQQQIQLQTKHHNTKLNSFNKQLNQTKTIVNIFFFM
ncbi:unnamed protein product [Rotaria magnacalcarata]